MRRALCILTLLGVAACTANDTQCLPPNKWYFCSMYCKVVTCDGFGTEEGKLEQSVCAANMDHAKRVLHEIAMRSGRVIDCSFPQCGEFQPAFDPPGGRPNSYAEAAAATSGGDWGYGSDPFFEECL
jgi:hypothetical protein